jgi:hypothetical protein
VVEWHGYGRAYPTGRRQIVGCVFHLSDSERYRRLNDVVCVCVGEVRAAGGYTEGFTLIRARRSFAVTEPPCGCASAAYSSRVALLTHSRSRAGAPAAAAAACTWSIDQRSSRTSKSMTRTGPGPVWSTPMIRIAAHPGIGPLLGVAAPWGWTRHRHLRSRGSSLPILRLRCICGVGKTVGRGPVLGNGAGHGGPTKRQHGRETPRRPLAGAGRPSSTSAGRPLKRDEQTLYAAGTNAPLHIGGRDCLQLPAATTCIFVENLR